MMKSLSVRGFRFLKKHENMACKQLFAYYLIQENKRC